ncbi:MAG: hypothetical protein ACQEQF_07665 [Bacillota bacterium]
MKNIIENYFPGANTPQGFFSYYKYLDIYAKKTYIIKGGPGCGKSTFMKKIAKKALDYNFSIEYHHCSSDNNSLDGIVIKEIKVAIIDGTPPHIVDPKYPGVVEEIIDFSKFWNNKMLLSNKTKIIDLTDEISNYFKKTYYLLNKSKKNYDLKLKKTLAKMDSKKIKDEFQQLSRKIFNDNFKIEKNNSQKKYFERHLFSTSLTPQGVISYLNEVHNNYKRNYNIISKRIDYNDYYFKKISKKLKENNFSVFYLHNFLEPKMINALIVPELSISITTNNYLDNIEKNEVADALTQLKKAKSTHDELEKIYISAMNFKKLDSFSENFISNLFN